MIILMETKIKEVMGYKQTLQSWAEGLMYDDYYGFLNHCKEKGKYPEQVVSEEEFLRLKKSFKKEDKRFWKGKPKKPASIYAGF